MILFIDDLRDPPPEVADDNVVVVRSTATALSVLGSFGVSHYWDMIFWDHDLGGDDTAYDLALHFAECAFHGQPIRVGLNIVHSSNPVGAANIAALLQRWSYRVQIRPVWWGTW